MHDEFIVADGLIANYNKGIRQYRKSVEFGELTVANVEGENPDFDALQVPAEGEAAIEPAEEGKPDAALDVEVAETAEALDESAEEAAEEGEEASVKERSKLSLYIEWACAICIPLVLLILAICGVLSYATAIYVIAVGFVPYGIWKGRETNTVYTVVLGCALIAVLTAIYCLWMEVGRYHFQINAKEAFQQQRFDQ